ncbi:MAG: sigma-70 family RNA polymerase sigma factor [bacterium]|nr:sigma-70 family RNA polymerase sigma factor [bacterium]
MAETRPGPVTQVLNAAAAGDSRAAAELLPLVYAELRKLARARMAHTPPGNTLQPTALVHEAYVRLIGSEDPGWNSRGHFFAAAAQAMRQILVDQARRKNSVKHGGTHKRVDDEGVDVAEPTIAPPAEDVLALNEALERLEEADPRKARIVMLRYFAGLSAAETAAALGVSVPTVERDWRFAKTLLYTLLSSPDSDPTETGPDGQRPSETG